MSPGDEKLGPELSAYLDGELGERDARRVEQALASDPGLRAELDALAAVRRLLGGVARASAPPGLAQRVILRTERATLLDGTSAETVRSSGGWLGRLAAAAVILVAVGVGVWVIANMDRTGGVGEGEVAVTGDDHVLRPPVVRKDADVRDLTPPAPPEPPPVVSYFVNTDNLELAQHDVQRVLARNGLQDVAMVNDEAPIAPKAVAARRGGFYDRAADAPKRVEIDVVIGEGQLRQIIAELNEVRSNQKVTQVPLREIDGLGETAGVDLAMAELTKAKDDARGRHAGKGGARDAPSKRGVDAPGPAAAPGPATRPATNGTIAVAAAGATATVAAGQRAMGHATADQVTSMPAGDVITMPVVPGPRPIRGGYVYAKIRQLRIVLNAVDAEAPSPDAPRTPDPHASD